MSALSRFALVLSVVLLIAGIGGFISTSVHYIALTRIQSAAPCDGAPAASCWFETRGTIDKVTDCGLDTCRVLVVVPTVAAPRKEMLVERTAGEPLHAGDAITARILGGELLRIGNDSGLAIARWDTLGRNRHNLDWELIIFCVMAMFGGFALKQLLHARDVRAGTTSPAQWARYAYLTLIALGVFSESIFVVLYVPASREARLYAEAPACSRPDKDCRLQTTAEALSQICHPNYYPPWCEVTLRVAGASSGAIANILRDDALALQHKSIAVELFHGHVTRLELDGRAIIPDDVAGQGVSRFRNFSLFALALIGWGVFGLVRLRRRRR